MQLNKEAPELCSLLMARVYKVLKQASIESIDASKVEEVLGEEMSMVWLTKPRFLFNILLTQLLPTW